MISSQQNLIESLSNISLPELLEKEELRLDEIFSVKDILPKIKRQMKIFIDYCKIKQSFTNRMITLGLKSPIDQNSSPEFKNLVYVSSDILTSDHESIANLLINSKDKQAYDSDEEDEIAEEIQTEENTHEIVQADKYKYLNQVFDYINGKDFQENCLNYIMKTLEILVRKKLNPFLQYFGIYPLMLQKLVAISHFPSVAHLLAKLLIDDEDDMSERAIEEKHKIVPLLLQKIHEDISQSRTLEVLECIEEVLNSSRYGDAEERSTLQKLSDVIVSENQLTFHINCIEKQANKPNEKSFNTLFNSVTYLNDVVGRMIMDEQSDYLDEAKPFKPTLSYSEKSIFPSFCRLISMIEHVESFMKLNQSNYKLLYVKYLDLLIGMTKSTYFGQYYSLISKEGRLHSIKILIANIANRKLSGILLQMTSSILQKIILAEQKISQTNPENPNKVSPSELYKLISEHCLSLKALTSNLMVEKANQRNRNEQGIYLRKLLLMLDNFFTNKEIQKCFTEVQSVSKLFPAFNLYNCKQFTDVTAVGKHPSYTKAKTPEEFQFIERNRNILNQASSQEIQNSKIMLEKLQQLEQLSKIQQQKKRKQNQENEKKEAIKSPKQQKSARQGAQLQPKQIKEIKFDSPTRPQVAPQPCLLFFIRHLAIY